MTGNAGLVSEMNSNSCLSHGEHTKKRTEVTTVIGDQVEENTYTQTISDVKPKEQVLSSHTIPISAATEHDVADTEINTIEQTSCQLKNQESNDAILKEVTERGNQVSGKATSRDPSPTTVDGQANANDILEVGTQRSKESNQK